MDFFQCLLVVLYITTLISGNTETTTMFQDIRIFSSAVGSWALAENLCQENGYRLVTMKNKSKRDALRQYVSKNDISTSTGFWLGMTEEPSGSSSWFWSDASQVQSESLLWKTGYPKPTVGQCVQINTFDAFLIIPASYGWQSKACSDTDPRIICEKDTSSPCTYSDHNVPNVCPRSSFFLMEERKSDSAASLDECQQKCSLFQNNDYECWSLTFEPSSDTCVLYCYYSPFLLSEILSESVFAQSCNNTHFQHKTCFSAILDNRTLTSTTSSTATSETLTTTTQSTTNFPTSANIPTTLATVTTTAEPITQFQTSATVEVPSMTSSPTTEMTSGSSTTTNELTSDSSATAVVSLSTTNKPTSSGVTNSRPKPLYLYPCPVTRCLKTSSNETLIQSIQRLTQELTISPNTTSAARRKKTCAEDTRSSAAAVGVVGIIILSVIGLLVVIPDAMSFVIHLKTCLSRKE